jgi:hypothetical protein
MPKVPASRGPALDIEQAQGQAMGAEGQGIV